MKLDGWEELIQDEDIADLIRNAVRKTFGDSIEKVDAKLDLELVDLVVDRYNLVVFFSFLIFVHGLTAQVNSSF